MRWLWVLGCSAGSGVCLSSYMCSGSCATFQRCKLDPDIIFFNHVLIHALRVLSIGNCAGFCSYNGANRIKSPFISIKIKKSNCLAALVIVVQFYNIDKISVYFNLFALLL